MLVCNMSNVEQHYRLYMAAHWMAFTHTVNVFTFMSLLYILVSCHHCLVSFCIVYEATQAVGYWCQHCGSQQQELCGSKATVSRAWLQWLCLPSLPAPASVYAATQVQPLEPGRGCRVEHVLAVKPLVSIPAAIAPYTSSIFKKQVADLLQDLEHEIIRQQAAALAEAN